jgi:hypothetical protein
MMNLTKAFVLGLGLLTGVAVAAQAQDGSVASLPPGAATAATPAPSAGYPGPNPGTGFYGGTVTQQQPVVPSPQYVGPAPGAGYYGTGPAYQKPADYEANTGMHPYNGGTGPRPN